jgi:NAD(P)-dependent dehydrogenase (short-subunit alcohol dehydrogenase family)
MRFRKLLVRLGGAYLFITGRHNPELAAAAKEIGRNATAVQADPAKLDDPDRLFAEIKREKGKLDIVFANAGTAPRAPLGEIKEVGMEIGSDAAWTP